MYFKTNDPSVIAAVENLKTEKSALNAETTKFVNYFGAKRGVFESSGLIMRFVGLIFDSPKTDKLLWTCQDKQSMAQRPRSPGKKPSKDLAALWESWNAHKPSTKPDAEQVLKAMGADWSITFIGGLKWFDIDGFVYAECQNPLAECMTEIYGSEFLAAHKKFEETNRLKNGN